MHRLDGEGARRTDADEALLLFGARRQEWLLNARAGATFWRMTYHGGAPYVRVAYERNNSTIALYEYRRIAIEVGISRAF